MAGVTPTGKRFSGVIVPMVTPLTAEGELDEPAIRRLVDHLVAGGVHGVFVLGTTGEGPSVPREMRARLVHLTLEAAGGRVRVYAGIMDTVVDESAAAGKDYLRRGAAAVVAALPSYFPLTGDEQFNYFATLARRIPGPILLYDTPQAVHMPIDMGVIEHLRAFPNVLGIKDSSGDQERLERLASYYGDDAGFAVLVGKTELANFGLRQGADGFVPSVANLNPALCVRLYASAEKGDWALMDELQRTIDSIQAEFSGETLGRTVAKLKRLMQKRGLCSARVFLPLEEEDETNRKAKTA